MNCRPKHPARPEGDGDPDYVKALGQKFPVYPGERETLDADIRTLEKAIKRGKKMRARIERQFDFLPQPGTGTKDIKCARACTRSQAEGTANPETSACALATAPLCASPDDSVLSDAKGKGKSKKNSKGRKGARACSCEKKFKQRAKTYLSSHECLMAAMVADNKKQPKEKRLSPRQIIELSKKYKILKNLNEPAVVREIPKKNGDGYREINEFGPVARAAQRMVTYLLGLTYRPQSFQVNERGALGYVEHALHLFRKETHDRVVEIDIRNFFPSFDLEELIATLPLPREAVRQIVVSENATWMKSCNHSFVFTPIDIKHPSGLPQGSVSSTTVAEWCVANFRTGIRVAGVDMANYVDNFFLIGSADKPLGLASKFLQSGITRLPGGSFEGIIKQSATIDEGVQILGCDIWRDGAGVHVRPSEENWQIFDGRFEMGLQSIAAKLSTAEEFGDAEVRLDGVRELVRHYWFLDGWCGAYFFCDKLDEEQFSPLYPGDRIEYIYAECKGRLDDLAAEFGVTPEEKAAASKGLRRKKFRPMRDAVFGSIY